MKLCKLLGILSLFFSSIALASSGTGAAGASTGSGVGSGAAVGTNAVNSPSTNNSATSTTEATTSTNTIPPSNPSLKENEDRINEKMNDNLNNRNLDGSLNK